LGLHPTEEAAARAYSKYLKDGIDPEPRGWCSSQFKGVSWDKQKNKWRALCNATHLGYHTTEEAAARAYSKYLKDGTDPIKHRTSQFTGVFWNKNAHKWQAGCKQKYLGLHTTEGAAAQAYNVEAERIGVALNVIPPAGAARVGAGRGAGPSAGGGAGPKRAASKTPAAPAPSKKTKRDAPKPPATAATNKTMKL